MSSNCWIPWDEVYRRESASLFKSSTRALRLIGAAKIDKSLS